MSGFFGLGLGEGKEGGGEVNLSRFFGILTVFYVGLDLWERKF